MSTLNPHAKPEAQIAISILCRPILEETIPTSNVFAFAYTIRIEHVKDNESRGAVKLIERHWTIESAGEIIGEVTGAGVVGVLPVIEPGDHFTYTSSSVIKDPIGAMYGRYTFIRLGKESEVFNVEIPRFTLIYDQLCN
jgi:ApaG protein